MPTPCDWRPEPQYEHLADWTCGPATETRGGSHVCRRCAADYDDFQAEEDEARRLEANSCIYDGPYFVDTMSGGCILL